MVLRLCLAALFLFAAIFAQSPLGTVSGLATDPTGAPISDAALTITNARTGVKQTTKTNSAGTYSLPNLIPGTYKVIATAAGFRDLETSEFPVDAYRSIRQDLKFELATSTAEVTVSATTSTVIQVDTPSISERLTSRQILDLPTNLRTIYSNAGDSGLIFIMLPETIPGVVQVGSGAKWITPGGVAAGTKLYVDGVETDFGNFGSPDSVSQPSFESIQEFTANILTNRAEFGGIGEVNTTTKSGTNSFHGDLFWYARNSAFDARNPFLVSKPFQNLHNYGAAVGGPAIRNKTFFYFVFDGTRGARPYPVTASVPSLAQRRGDFSAFTALKNPFTGANFPGNQIPAQLISPQALAAQQQFFPLPNFGPPDSTSGNYRAAFNGSEVHRDIEIRIDHNFSDRHSVFARYQEKKDNYQIPGARSTLPPSSVGTSTNIRRVNFWTAGDVYSPTSNLSNEFRAGVPILVSASDANIRGQQLLDRIGITGLPSRAGIKGVPNISITGLNMVTQNLLNPVNDGHWQAGDNLSWIRGRHSFKFGGQFVDWFVNRYLTTNPALFGNFSFQNRFSGNPYADFLLGLPTTVVRLDPFPTQYNRWHDFALYAQDDFKAMPRLTLSYGLRYEYNQPVHANDDNLYSFDLATGSIVVPNDRVRRLFSPYFPASLPVVTASQVGLDRTLRHSDKNNFAPRFGFSYQADRDARTVVRGGWGVFYSHLSGNEAADLSSGPFAVSTTNTNAIANGAALFTFGAPFAIPGSSGTLNLNGVAPRLLNSLIQQYSLSVERQVSSDAGVRVSYIGSHGSQLIYQRNVNQPVPSMAFAQSRRPYPLFNTILYGDNGANSSYNGLQAQVQKRMSHGLLFSSAWTWAKELSEIDDTGDFELNSTIENAYDRRRERANVYAVPRHQWENQILWEPPLGRGLFRGGWQINALFNMSSGNWLNETFTGSDPSGTNNLGGRPDVAGTLAYPRSVDAWFDRSAFQAPSAGSGRFGNAGRNLIQGPGFVLLNMGLSKELRFEKIGSLQLIGSFQNVINHENLGEPNTVINNPIGGKITSTHIFPPAGSPRSGQLGARWNF
ncbi:MAG: carboxypeptidase regulatory-like domain-containing protein [Bryobacteraceae bacterium]